MIKRILLAGLLAAAGTLAAAPEADAGVYLRPIAPVRRVAARAVLPPYPVARAAVVAPIYRPVVAPVYRGFYGPHIYGAPYVYGPGVSVRVGF
jgi:hypothetical protein